MTGTLTLDLGLDQPRARGDRHPPRRPAAAPRALAPTPAAAPRELGAAPDVAPRALAPTPPASPRELGAAPDAAPRALAPTPPAAPGASRTLDDLISGAWGELAAHHTVACPVCTGPMAPRYGSGARPVGGRCRRCGSTLG